MSQCSSCHAEILWGRTLNGSRAMPVDPEPSEDGNVRLHRQGFGGSLRLEVLGAQAAAVSRAAGEQLHTAHFVTCPNAEQHRRRRA